ncbi:MAG: T9SS type A sorting domain-containing protein [Bacteroidota bacterium]
MLIAASQLFFSPIAIAQSTVFERSFDGVSVSYARRCIGSGSNWYTIHRNSYGYSVGDHITAVNKYNENIWSYTPEIDDERYGIDDVLYDNASASFFFTLSTIPCDVPSGFRYVQRLNADGTLRWSVKVDQAGNNGFLYRESAIGLGADEQLWLLYKKESYPIQKARLMRFDSSGSALLDTVFNFTFESMLCTDNGVIVSANNALFAIDHQGNVTDSVYTGRMFTTMARTDGGFQAVSDLSLYRISPELSLEDSLDLGENFSSVSVSRMLEGNWWFMGMNAAGTKTIIVETDTAFNQDKQIVLPYNSLVTGADLATNGNLLMMFVDKPSFVHQTTASYRVMDGAHPVWGNADVELIHLEADSVKLINFVPNVYRLEYRLRATVFNHGPDTLKYVEFNEYLGSGICDIGVIFEKMETAIPPLQQQEFLLPGNYSTDHMYFSDSAKFNLCLWTSSPDHSIDVDLDNDKFCVRLSIPLGVAEYAGKKRVPVLFPNPASGEFTISGDEFEAYNYRLLDHTGKELYTGKTVSGQAIRPDQLSAGLYFLHVTDQSGNFHVLRLMVHHHP